ncbi:LysR family transcriptional regulator [Vibrio sp. 10N.222.54.F6]|uniref:helix-turn-helix domain-containing protein n=1 Tax=unclassified Vibrio TaxID=2614977 RepID=UPI00354F1049
MSRTARRMGKTISAISKSMQKICEELDDELLVRQSSGFQLTNSMSRAAGADHKSFKFRSQSLFSVEHFCFYSE